MAECVSGLFVCLFVYALFQKVFRWFQSFNTGMVRDKAELDRKDIMKSFVLDTNEGVSYYGKWNLEEWYN